MEVPSVREKLTGSNDSGLNRLGIVVQYRRTCRGSGDGWRDQDPATKYQKKAYAMAPPLDKPKRSARTGKRMKVAMKRRGEGKRRCGRGFSSGSIAMGAAMFSGWLGVILCVPGGELCGIRGRD